MRCGHSLFSKGFFVRIFSTFPFAILSPFLTLIYYGWIAGNPESMNSKKDGSCQQTARMRKRREVKPPLQ
jgi:hypothetical protein